MISICIASYNGQSYISDQILSILPQLDVNDEVIISDDNSTDKTLQKISEINDPRIKIIKNNIGKGYTRNFENAIMHANGDLIFLSDQDDIWNKDKLKIMVGYLKKYDTVVCNADFVDEQLISLGYTFFELRNSKTGFLKNLYKLRYLGCCMAFKREVLHKLLPFPKNSKLCTHDMWLTAISEMYFKVLIIDTPLQLYRRHMSNASYGGLKSSNSFFFQISLRSYVLYHSLLRLLR